MATGYGPARLSSELNVTTIDLRKLTESTVLFQLSFSMGIGKMRQISVKVTGTTADPSKLRHQKVLIESEALEAIRSADGYLKRWVESKCCKFGVGDSQLLVPGAYFDEVYDRVTDYAENDRPTLVAKFMQEYRELEAQDFAPLRVALGDKFKRDEYAQADIVESGFGFSFRPIPLGVPDEQMQRFTKNVRTVQREQQKANALMMKAAEEWRQTLRQMGAEMVNTLLTVLKPGDDGKRKKLFDTTVDKLQDFLNTFSVRNITDDAAFAEQVHTLRGIMAGVSTEKLRHSDNLKDKVAQGLAAVKQQLTTLTEVQGRRFRD
jgi:hypothetical protein